MDAETSRLFPSGFSDENGTPEGWTDGELGSICRNIRENCAPDEIGESDKYVALDHFDRRCITLWRSGLGGDATSNKSRFKKGDLLFGKLRPYFHKVAIAPFDGLCSTDVLVIRAKKPEMATFSYFALFQDRVIKHATATSEGTKMPRTNWSRLAAYRIAIPPAPLMDSFHKAVFPMCERMAAIASENENLVALRDTLLPRLLSGKLLVSASSSDD